MLLGSYGLTILINSSLEIVKVVGLVFFPSNFLFIFFSILFLYFKNILIFLYFNISLNQHQKQF
jgi:hypothetical protein